jgi:hypothetical protein
MKRYWREFLRGATTPSAPALLGACSVCVLLFLLCLAFVTESLLASLPSGSFMTDAKDEFALLTGRSLALERGTPSGPGLVILGSSASREAFCVPGDLQAMLAEATGGPVWAENLSCGGLNLWEIVTVLGNVPPEFRGVVAVEISPNTLSTGTGSLRKSLRSPRPALDASALYDEALILGSEVPRRTGNFFLDHYKFFVSRPLAIANLVFRPVEPVRHFAAGWTPPTPGEWDRAVGNIGRWRTAYVERSGLALGVLGRAVSRLRAGGDVRVLFVEALTNPAAMDQIMDSDEAREVRRLYLRDVAALADSLGCGYWDPMRTVELPPSDFIDQNHLKSDAARRRVSTALAVRVAPLFVDLGGNEEVGR